MIRYIKPGNLSNTPSLIEYVKRAFIIPGVLATPLPGNLNDLPDYTGRKGPGFYEKIKIIMNIFQFGQHNLYPNTFDINPQFRKMSIDATENKFSRLCVDIDAIKKITLGSDNLLSVSASQGIFNPIYIYDPIIALALQKSFMENKALLSLLPYNYLDPIEQVALKKTMEILMELQRSPNVQQLTLIGHSNGGLVAYHIGRYLEEFAENGFLDYMTNIYTDEMGNQKIDPNGLLKKLTFIDPGLQETLKEIIASGKLEIVSIMTPFKGSVKANVIDVAQVLPISQFFAVGAKLLGSIGGTMDGQYPKVPPQLISRGSLSEMTIRDGKLVKLFPGQSDESDKYNRTDGIRTIMETTKANKYCFFSKIRETPSEFGLVKPDENDSEPPYFMPILTEPGDGTVTMSSQISDLIAPENIIEIRAEHRDGLLYLPEILALLPSLKEETKGFMENLTMLKERQ
ncbi:hypothetical protein FBZ82_116107 [Azospirillum brasilense]|uniref:Alpha/beta hydrolase n=2 Tax=Azospirillum brasilense TaxID=192 RepID=A0A560AP03_AZOBR|nr:hypothetical protein FBZ82_116107 [Azospirillum brasilense]